MEKSEIALCTVALVVSTVGAQKAPDRLKGGGSESSEHVSGRAPIPANADDGSLATMVCLDAAGTR